MYGGGLDKFDRSRNIFSHYRHDPDDSTSISSDFIWNIHEDKKGNLWIGTDGGGLDKFDYQENIFHHYQSDSNEQNSISDDHIYAILEDRQGNLWIGTSHGLNRYNYKTGSFSQSFIDVSNRKHLEEAYITCLYEDQQGILWIGTEGDGLNKFSLLTGELTHYKSDSGSKQSISNDYVTSIYEDNAGILWIGTEDGLNIFHRESGIFEGVRKDVNNLQSISDDGILSIYEDRSGILWVGTISGGLNMLDREGKPFNHIFRSTHTPDVLTNNHVYSFCEDRNGHIWVGTIKGLNLYDPITGLNKHFLHDPGDPGSIINNSCWTVLEDASGTIWVGTEEGLDRYQPQTNSFAHFIPNPENEYNGGINAIYIIFQDRDYVIWVGTSEGLLLFDAEAGVFSKLDLKDEISNILSEVLIITLFEDRYNYLWVGTETDGLFVIDPARTKIERYLPSSEDPNSINTKAIMSVYEDKAGNIWIGTFGSGLNRFDRETGKFTFYTTMAGLPNDVIYGILEDRWGNLWLSTNKGLSKFDSRNDEFKNYDVRDGLQSNEFNSGANYQNPAGMMFFGGVNGYNMFYPDSIKDNIHVPPVVLTDFQLFNKSVGIAEDSPLSKSITETETIELFYDDYVFSIEYAALNYNLSAKNQYAYMLEGFESDWNYVKNRRLATYTSIPHGSYTFRVIGSNNDGVWNTEGAALNIIIHPPYWQTGWFRFIIISLLLSFGILIHKLRTRIIKRRSEKLERINTFLKLEIQERKKAEQERERALLKAQQSEKVKTLFLANMSHEIRTPLNNILGYVDLLEKNIYDQISEDEKTFFDSIRRGGDRLMKTVHAVLDISQIEAGTYTLDPTSFDLIELLKKLLFDFAPQAKVKRISLKFKSEVKEATVDVDKYCLTQAIVNIIENALKYTSQGSIRIIVKRKNASYQIVISDTGIGMSHSYQKKLFEPFSQESTGYTRKYQGVGLGLALAKHFIKLCEGQIQVNSKKDQGSVFTVSIPVAPGDQEEKSTEKPKNFNPPTINFNNKLYQTKKTVLVVEDDAATQNLMKYYLKDKFRVKFAESVEDGKKILMSNLIDIVLLDLSLKGDEDGLALTRFLRASKDLKQIPVIAVTAHAFISDREKVLAAGCNGFLTKPLKQADLIDKINKNL